MMSYWNGRVSGRSRSGCGDGTYTDSGRTSGSEVSPELSEAELSPSPSESDETDGARKVPLLRGDLIG